jgi:flagellar hook capping protein FlgD
MKVNTVLRSIVCLTFFLLVVSTSKGQNLLDNPESIVYDSLNERYIVSNWGNGAIVQINSDGDQSYFNTDIMNQYKVAGLYRYGDTLLAASGDGIDAGITGFNINSGEQLFHIILPDVGLPNDITSDINGIIYVTDYWDDKIYRIENRVPSVLIDQGIDHPNGIYYDKSNHRLLVLSVTGPGTPILGIDINTLTISTVVTTGLSGMDGITRDNENNYYISEWTGDAILKYDSLFTNPPEVFSSGHIDPADIYYNKVLNILCVPNFHSNSIDFVQLITSVNEYVESNVVDISLKQNYPNPFSNTTTIEYQISNQGISQITVYDIAGKKIKTLQNRYHKQGQYSVIWDRTDNNGNKARGGLYYYELTNANQRQQKILIIQ